MVSRSIESNVMYGKYKNNIVTLFLAFLVLGMLVAPASAFYFRGYTYNESNVTLNNTIVSIEVYSPGGQNGLHLNATFYNSSNENGFFNVSVPLEGEQYMYKPVLKHYLNNETSGTLDWIGQSLPQFPLQMISHLTANDPMNFYLRKGGTIYINASGLNQSTSILEPAAFKYVIKDTRMGYPVAENFATDQYDVGPIYVPLERNYSIMIMPNQSLPVSYELNNLSTYTNYTVNITLNTSLRPVWVSGYANLSDGTSNFTTFKIITYLMEPGNMIGKDRPMPSNMSGFRPGGSSDIFTASTGFYNITLPGSAQGSGANILMFVSAFNSSTGNYSGAFKKITLNYSSNDRTNINFTLYGLEGREENISVTDKGTRPSSNVNITTKMVPFQLKNGTGPNITESSAHVEIHVDYSAYGGAAFKWMVGVSGDSNGSFSIPAISANISKINVFMQNFAPKKTSKNTTQLANWPVNIGMNSFENKKPGQNGGQLSGEIKMDMLISKDDCDRPNPAYGCSLLKGHGGQQDQNQSDFNPFKIVLGGGKISLRIKQTSTNITVHYVNVDMLASGPPDALFDENKTQSQSGSSLEQAWKFGSNGPEIYDYVLIGMPIDSSLNASNLTIKLGGLYDENWKEQWNMSAGDNLNNLPSEYNEFNETLFNSTGMPCSTVDLSGGCYVNLTNRKVWLRIPHFSGFRSTISSESVGGVNVTLSPSSGTQGSTVNMNFTIRDDLNSTSWFNFSFPARFSIVGAIVDYFIDGNRTGWTVLGNSTGSDYINVSSGVTFAYSGNTAYINISNITITGGVTAIYSINVTTNNSLTVPLTYNVTAASSSGPAIIPLATTYDPSSGGFANEVMPNFTLNVQVINTSNGVNLTNVQVNISSVNNTIGNFTMVLNTSSEPYYTFNLTARVEKVVRGTFNVTVTAYDDLGNSNTTNLSIEAHMYPGLNVIGWNSSKARPAYPTNVSLFYNSSPVIIIVNTTDDTHYSNITIDFSGVDANSTLVFNNSGVLQPDGRNYSYTLRHTLGNIPIDDVTIAWVNATISIQGVDVIIPQSLGALVVVSNVNPRDMPNYDLSGATTDWKSILDYSAAYLTFEKVTIGGANATLKFNVPINLTDYTTATNLRTLGDNLIMAERSINLTAAENALREFNKSANITISNLTAFTTSPAIFQNGIRIALPDETSGGAAANISWDQSSHTLTLNVSHWTNYSWGTYGANLTNVSALTGSANVGTNVTYVFTLQNNGTLSDSYNLTISNPNGASTAVLNVTGNISLASNEVRTLSLNVSHGYAGTFPVNVTATSVNYSNRAASINTTTTMNAVQAVNFSNVTGLSQTTPAGTNATYTLLLTNNGSAIDTYTLSVTNSGASTAILNESSVTLGSLSSRVLLLNVTNTSSGIFYVNVTANSTGNVSKLGYLNTTTNVTAVRAINFSNITGLSQSTLTEINMTYSLNLMNNGSDRDTYTLVVDDGGASVAAVNRSSIPLVSGASQIILLNVTNNASGIFYVNVTARSNNDTTKVGYINTTTTVTNATGSVNGTITDIMFGTPITNVTITLTNSTGGIKLGETNSSGYYNITDVVTSISTPYIYTISASKTNYTTNSSVTVTVVNSTTTTSNISLRALNGTLRGSYIKNGTGIEVSGAIVSLTNTTLGTITRTTDASGTYSASLYPAIYFVNVSKTGYSNNSTSATVVSNDTTTVPTNSLVPNTVTVTANRTVGSADSGQNVSFNLTVVNIGENAIFNVATSVTNTSTIVTNTTNPIPLLLNTSNSTGYVVVVVNNSNFGGWPVTITISNSSKSASITLNAIMRNATAPYTNISSTVEVGSNVTGSTLVNAIVQNNATISGNSTLIMNATVTGEGTDITDGAVIKGTYVDSNIDNSTIGNATVDSSNLNSSTISGNATVTNSTLTDATVDNSTLTNVTVRSGSIITNVANLRNITLGGVTVTGDSAYEYEGRITGGAGWATYQGINFTTVYADIRISQLVIEQGPNTDVGSGSNFSINDTSLGTSMNFSMIVNLSNPAVINISETGISPDGAGFSSGTRLGNFLHIRSNDTNNSNVTRHILRLYFDTNPSTYTGGVKIYYYNRSTPAWEILTTTGSGTEGNRYYIEAEPNHFSTFALLGTTTTGGDGGNGGSSGSGGSGGGGGGGSSSENHTNIEVVEKYDMQISKDALTTYRFTHAKNPIMFVNITGNTSLGLITASIEVLKNNSTLVNISPGVLVYRNANIWVGTSGYATPKNIKEARIKFRVDNEWMRKNGVLASDIVLVKWNGKSWIDLETKVLSKDDTNAYLEGKTNAFSPFAIVAKIAPGGKTEITTQNPAGTPKITATLAPEPTKKTPGFGIVLALLGLMAVVFRKRSW